MKRKATGVSISAYAPNASNHAMSKRFNKKKRKAKACVSPIIPPINSMMPSNPIAPAASACTETLPIGAYVEVGLTWTGKIVNGPVSILGETHYKVDVKPEKGCFRVPAWVSAQQLRRLGSDSDMLYRTSGSGIQASTDGDLDPDSGKEEKGGEKGKKNLGAYLGF